MGRLVVYHNLFVIRLIHQFSYCLIGCILAVTKYKITWLEGGMKEDEKSDSI
jgi:hypothetical protein